MKALFMILLFVAPAVQAEIYRCDTPLGQVFSDTPCGEQAELVTVDAGSSGISIGPSEEVRQYLAEQRDERASAREERQRTQAARPPEPVVITEYETVGYPVYWRNPGYPNAGYPNRPRPPRPRPEPPIINRPDPGVGVIRPRR